MRLFTRRNKDSQRLFLAGWEAKFNGDSQCYNFMHTQAIHKLAAENLGASIELVFEEGRLVKAFDYENGTKSKRSLRPEEIGLKYINIEPNTIYILDKTENGNSYIGGEPPLELTMPRFDFVAPFQYLGMISSKDEPFEWLPFDLHLIAPIYLNFDQVLVDYSNPLSPTVINLSELSEAGNSYEDELKVDSEIVFDQTFVSFEEASDFMSGYGHTGVPQWIQFPSIPLSPISKKAMKFVLQLTSNSGIGVKHSNVTSNDEWMLQYFEHLNFWGDGELFLFFDLENNIASYLIQNT